MVISVTYFMPLYCLDIDKESTGQMNPSLFHL